VATESLAALVSQPYHRNADVTLDTKFWEPTPNPLTHQIQAWGATTIIVQHPMRLRFAKSGHAQQ
jgi:hypothetical protein